MVGEGVGGRGYSCREEFREGRRGGLGVARRYQGSNDILQILQCQGTTCFRNLRLGHGRNGSAVARACANQTVVMRRESGFPERIDVEVVVLSVCASPEEEPPVGHGDMEIDHLAGHSRDACGPVTDVGRIRGRVGMVESKMRNVFCRALCQAVLAALGDLKLGTDAEPLEVREEEKNKNKNRS